MKPISMDVHCGRERRWTEAAARALAEASEDVEWQKDSVPLGLWERVKRWLGRKDQN